MKRWLAILLFLAFAASARAQAVGGVTFIGGTIAAVTWTHIQDNQCFAAACAFSTNVTAGNILQVGANFNGPSHGVTDTQGNTWVCPSSAATGTNISQCYVLSALSTGPDTITTDVGVTTAMVISEDHRSSGTATFDQGNSATGSSTSPASGSVTTTAASELITGMFVNNSSSTSYTHGSGFTAFSGFTGTYDFGQYQAVSSIGAYNSTATVGSTQTWAASVLTFY